MGEWMNEWDQGRSLEKEDILPSETGGDKWINVDSVKLVVGGLEVYGEIGI